MGCSYPLHRWWWCHLLENGGVDDFTQMAVEFRNEAELRASEWFDYVDQIYGIETLRYPFHLGALAYFHFGKLPPSGQGVYRVPQGEFLLTDPDTLRYGDFVHALYPIHTGDVWRIYRHLNSLCVDWLQTACLGGERVLTRGAPDHSYVEVQHACCDGHTQGGSTLIGFWHYLAPGSGVFFNVGKTFAARDHATMSFEIQDRLGCDQNYLASHGIGHGWGPFGVSFECLRAHGFDSIQFTHHMEHSMDLYEVVNLHDTHNQREYNPNCPDAANAHRYRQGWDATVECKCLVGSWGLNCDG